ncbi:MAG: shikimate kinase [Actinomycetota bacterium]
MSLVWLIGMPGSGKSTVGRTVADRLGAEFVDVDGEVERRAGKQVHAIFESDGEAAFRSLEADVIRGLASRDGVVVACGGGAVLDPETRERMRSSGTVVLLEAPIEALAARLGAASETRPLVRAPGDLERLASERVAFYRAAAHVTVDAAAGPAEIAAQIAEALS